MREKNVYLKHLEEEDIEKLLELRFRNREFLQPYEPIKPESHFTYEGLLKEHNLNHSDAVHDKTYTYGIFLENSRHLIGRISLSSVVRGPFQNGNLGYYLDKNWNGKGYASEAVALLLKIAFMELNLHRIQAAVMPNNIASIRVLEKTGFNQIGLSPNYLKINGSWEDHFIYAVTYEDYIG